MIRAGAPAGQRAPEMVPPVPGTEGHRFLFIAGLHRSGTSIVHRCLRDHPQVSGFMETGAPEDEGQHLQTVFPPARHFGGPGRFGWHPGAHQTEAEVSPGAAEQLWREWSPHWQLDRMVLAEKSPPNLLRMRFLQRCFPASYFVVVTRHPVATAYATRAFTRRRFRKWRHRSIGTHLRHWFHCHRIFETDRAHVRNLMVLRYEDFAADPQGALGRVAAFVGIQPGEARPQVRTGTNDKYFGAWRRDLGAWWGGARLRRSAEALEAQAASYGYSLLEVG